MKMKKIFEVLVEAIAEIRCRLIEIKCKITRSDDIDLRHRKEQRIEEDLRNYGWSPKVDISTIRRYIDILNKTKSTNLVR